jgi:hypothetical protein
LNKKAPEHVNPAKNKSALSGRAATETDTISHNDMPNRSTSKQDGIIYNITQNKDRRIVLGTHHLSAFNEDGRSSNDDQNDMPGQSLLLSSMNDSVGFASEMINTFFTSRAMHCTQA